MKIDGDHKKSFFTKNLLKLTTYITQLECISGSINKINDQIDIEVIYLNGTKSLTDNIYMEKIK